MELIINPGKRFAEKAQMTAQPKKKGGIFTNSRDALSIAKVYENGMFKIEQDANPCLYDRAYIFSDINYINCDGEQKNRVLDSLIRFLNFMNVDFKITVANEYRNMKSYIDRIFSDQNRERYPDIAEGMKDWIKQKVSEADLHDLERVLYLTITTRSFSYEEARSFFLGMDVELEHLFQGLHSQIFPLKAEQRLKSIQKFFYRDEDENPITFNVPRHDPVLDVMPYSVDASYRDFMVF